MIKIYNPESNQIPYYDDWNEVVASNFNQNPIKFTTEMQCEMLYGRDGIDENHAFAFVRLSNGQEVWVYQDYMFYESGQKFGF